MEAFSLQTDNMFTMDLKEEEASAKINVQPRKGPQPQESCAKSASLAEISSLLTMAMPKANVGLLHDEDEDGEGDGVVTMEAAESEVVSLALLPELVS